MNISAFTETDSTPDDDLAPMNCVYPVIGFSKWSTRIYFYFIMYLPLYLSVIVFGVIGNWLSFVVLGLEKPFTSTSVLLRSLAVADILVLLSRFLLATLPQIYTFYGVFMIYKEFYGVAYRYLWTFVWVAKTWSVYVTVCVAAERYIAICRPLRAASFCTIRNARVACLFVVIFSIFYRIPYLFTSKAVWKYDPCTESYKPVKVTLPVSSNIYYKVIYTMVLHNVLMSYLPIFSLIFFTNRLLRALKRSANIGLLTSGGRTNDNIRATTVRVLAVVNVFIVLELPGSLIQIVNVINRYSNFKGFIDYWVYQYCLTTCYFLGVINSFINFYIYCLTGSRFRRTLLNVLRWPIRGKLKFESSSKGDVVKGGRP